MSGPLETFVREIGDLESREIRYEGVTIEEACQRFAKTRFRLLALHHDTEGCRNELHVVARRGKSRWPLTVMRRNLYVVKGLRGGE